MVLRAKPKQALLFEEEREDRRVAGKPTTYRSIERDEMTTPAVTEHIELARSFLQRSKSYLDKGDLHQASEKGWGAATHIIKAVAVANGWEYEHHDQFDKIVVNAGQKYRQPSLRDKADAAHGLHISFYKRKQFIETEATRGRIENVEYMIGVLEPFIR